MNRDFILQREEYNSICTKGGLFLSGGQPPTHKICETLEDPPQATKIFGKTRIPEGRYKITLRQVGGVYKKYKKRFGFCRGVPWVRNVKNFKFILIHIGNTAKDTKGCILVGERHENNTLQHSSDAYAALETLISNFINKGDKVFIDVRDEYYYEHKTVIAKVIKFFRGLLHAE